MERSGYRTVGVIYRAFDNWYERLYSASLPEERLLASSGTVVYGNSFSPKHFYRYLDNQLCKGYNTNWWYALQSLTPINSVEHCFQLCLGDINCHYFAYQADTSNCSLLSSCIFEQNNGETTRLFFQMNTLQNTFPISKAYFWLLF